MTLSSSVRPTYFSFLFEQGFVVVSHLKQCVCIELYCALTFRGKGCFDGTPGLNNVDISEIKQSSLKGVNYSYFDPKTSQDKNTRLTIFVLPKK